MKNERFNIKNIFISSICFIYLIIILFFIFMDGVGKKGSYGVSGFIEQDHLRKSLGDWYQLIFYTFQVNIYFLIIGISYVFLSKSKIINNLFFCSSTLLFLCLLSMFVFKFDSFKYNSYGATKTIFVHLLIPISSFIMVFIIRKEIFLEWKILWINSLYIPIYIILTVIVYYLVNFAPDTNYPNQPLWIYKFLDYNNQILFIPLPGIGLTILGIVILILLTPPFGMFLFALSKMVFGISIEKTNSSKFNAFLNWNISS
ncbi:MAG: hypothetical protein IJ997_02030 [Mycoplasmataceae bacterium]|nr:hypothetical protein [Mycoplasmataceae bacterium]